MGPTGARTTRQRCHPRSTATQVSRVGVPTPALPAEMRAEADERAGKMRDEKLGRDRVVALTHRAAELGMPQATHPPQHRGALRGRSQVVLRGAEVGIAPSHFVRLEHRVGAASLHRAQDLTEGAGRSIARPPQLAVSPTSLMMTTVTNAGLLASRRGA